MNLIWEDLNIGTAGGIGVELDDGREDEDDEPEEIFTIRLSCTDPPPRLTALAARGLAKLLEAGALELERRARRAMICISCKKDKECQLYDGMQVCFSCAATFAMSDAVAGRIAQLSKLPNPFERSKQLIAYLKKHGMKATALVHDEVLITPIDIEDSEKP